MRLFKMSEKDNTIISICIVGLALCTVLGITAIALDLVKLYRLAFFLFACVYTFSIRKYKTEEHRHEYMRKILKYCIWILIIVALLGLLNTYAEWFATEPFIRVFRFGIVALFPIEAIYLAKIKHE